MYEKCVVLVAMIICGIYSKDNVEW